ncbi:hypothetical protein KAR91_02010 [Candidatus Pacearchaeota archaeon]|nr:hypothetical protein [Candidatus Pacearchaeota archaeon]
MNDNETFIARHITVLGTGDMQTGFCRNGLNFKASIDALIILRGFSYLGSGEIGSRSVGVATLGMLMSNRQNQFAGSSPASPTN